MHNDTLLPFRFVVILASFPLLLLSLLVHPCILLVRTFLLLPYVIDHCYVSLVTITFVSGIRLIQEYNTLTGLLLAINFLQYLHQCFCAETQKSALEYHWAYCYTRCVRSRAYMSMGWESSCRDFGDKGKRRERKKTAGLVFFSHSISTPFYLVSPYQSPSLEI